MVPDLALLKVHLAKAEMADVPLRLVLDAELGVLLRLLQHPQPGSKTFGEFDNRGTGWAMF